VRWKVWNYALLGYHSNELPITVAARSKSWIVFACSNAGIVGSNPTQGMDVCVRLFCVCVVLCVGSGLATGWSPVQGVLPTVYRIKKWKKRRRSNKMIVEPHTATNCWELTSCMNASCSVSNEGNRKLFLSAYRVSSVNTDIILIWIYEQ
jgi:hypothetical protein